MSINQEDLTTALSEAFGGGPASPEGIDYARRILEQGLKSPGISRDVVGDVREQQEDILGALQQARERIMEQRSVSKSEKWFALAAGLGAPTRAGGFGETAANVAEQFQPLAARQSEFDIGRDEALSKLDIAEAGVFAPVHQLEGDLAQLEYEQNQLNMRQAMKTIARGTTGAGGATREAKIQDLIGGWGYNRPDASALVDGFVEIELVPETGMARLINQIDQSVVSVPIGSLEGYMKNLPDDYVAPPGGTSTPGEKDLRTDAEVEADIYAGNMIKEGRSMWEMAALGTGPVSSVREGLSFVSSMFGYPVATETLIARQGLTMRTKNLVGILIANDSARMSIPLIEMTMKEAATTPEFIDTGPMMQARMVELDGFLYNQYVKARADANNPNLGHKLRVKQQTVAEAFGTFLRDLGVPRDQRRRGLIVPEDYMDPKEFGDELPELPDSPPKNLGMSQGGWDAMTPQQKARITFLQEQLNREAE